MKPIPSPLNMRAPNGYTRCQTCNRIKPNRFMASRGRGGAQCQTCAITQRLSRQNNDAFSGRHVGKLMADKED